MLENMLEYLRITLYTLLFVLAFFLYQAWEREHPKSDIFSSTSSASSTSSILNDQTLTVNHFVPTLPEAAVTSRIIVPAAARLDSAAPLVKVKTDVLEVTIDTRGGDIVGTNLLKYPESLNSSFPYRLLNNQDKTRYLAESGLLSKIGPDTAHEQALYTTMQTNYVLSADANEIKVQLHWQKDGIFVTKQFTFMRNSYEVKIGYDIHNQSKTLWQGSLYTQLMRTDAPPANQGGFVNLATYFGAAISSPKKPFEKITFKQMRENTLSESIQGGWAAMIQHYFITAWIPPKDSTSTYYSKVTQNGLYTIGMIGQPLSVAPGATTSTEAKLYAGPAKANLLEKAAPGLKLTIDYGWFWFISDIIFWMMLKIYDVIGNWGWSIVLVTVIIKLIFYQLSAKSYRSMSALKKLQPRIAALKERFGDDRQKLTQATLEMYRQEKVNPMSGCLPILIQIPVFIALYWVLVESVELRQAPFMFWIHDLSQQDPYFVLPVLMGISMFVQQRLNPPPPDPLQAKVMMAMPIVFTVLFVNFPAGLMLYWFVNNTLSFLQQWYIMYRLDHAANFKK
jgi:YidC/Oxa1 family membrane protein insertase